MPIQIDHNSFRQQLLSRREMIEAFVKTPGIHPVEILAEVGFDFLVLDEEHAALDRAAIATTNRFAPEVRSHAVHRFGSCLG